MKVKLFCIRRKRIVAVFCLLAALAIIGLVNHPAIVGAAATTRQLPIYCVQRDQKMVAISFDAAWGDVRLRQQADRQRACRGSFLPRQALFV